MGGSGSFAQERDLATRTSHLPVRRYTPRYAACVEETVAKAIRNSETSDLLEVKTYGSMRSFMTQEQRAIAQFLPKPKILISTARPPKPQWAHDLVQYMRDVPQGDFHYEAGIERVLSEACNTASKSYFTSPEIRDVGL
jgi:hypothetical protein